MKITAKNGNEKASDGEEDGKSSNNLEKTNNKQKGRKRRRQPVGIAQTECSLKCA